jgi:Phage integrase family
VPARPWSTSRRITPSSPTFGGVEMASNSECSRLPALAAMASRVSSVTTYSYFKPAARAAGLPPTLRFYDLRHTAASLLIHESASVKAMQRQLDHATASITLNTYGHLLPETSSWTRFPAAWRTFTPGAGGAAGRRGVAPRSSRSANVQVSSLGGSCRRRARTRRLPAPRFVVVAVNAVWPAILACRS